MNKRLIVVFFILSLLGACSIKPTESSEQSDNSTTKTATSTAETAPTATKTIVTTQATTAITESSEESETTILEDDISKLPSFLWESDFFLGGEQKMYALSSGLDTIIVLCVIPKTQTYEDIKKNIKIAEETKYQTLSKVNSNKNLAITTAFVAYIERTEDGFVDMLDYVGGDMWEKAESDEYFNYLYGLTAVGWIDEDYKAAYQEYEEESQEETESVQRTTLVYEDEYVTISYSHIGEPDWMDRRGVVFTVENKTDYVLTFQADSLAINGIDLGNISMSDEISPQSTGEISAKSDKVTATTVSKISGQFRVIEWDNELFGALSYDAKFVNVEVS